MIPTSLPELPKPSRTPGKNQKREFSNPKKFQKKYEKIINFLISSFFLGPPPGEMDPRFSLNVEQGMLFAFIPGVLGGPV